VRHDIARGQSKTPQHLQQKRRRGDPIDIVVAEDEDFLLTRHRPAHAVHRRTQMRDAKGIVQRRETRLQKRLHRLGILISPLPQDRPRRFAQAHGAGQALRRFMAERRIDPFNGGHTNKCLGDG